jgi:hypothetical protein
MVFLDNICVLICFRFRIENDIENDERTCLPGVSITNKFQMVTGGFFSGVLLSFARVTHRRVFSEYFFFSSRCSDCPCDINFF